MTPEWVSEKIQTFKIYITCHFKARDLKIWNMFNYFREIFKFCDFINTLRNFAKFVLLVFSRNLNILLKKYINGISRSRALK